MSAKYFIAKPEPVTPETKVCPDTAAGKREYYRRTREMAARQNELCAICGQFMISPTFEHQDGRGMNGSHRDDRTEIDGRWHNAALCFKCQSKGSKRYRWVEGKYQQVEARHDVERKDGSSHSDASGATSVA